MLRRILFLFYGFLIASSLLGQATSNKKTPIKFRLLMTTVNVVDLNNEEITVTLNAFNTGRNPIDFSTFNAIPQEMEIKFEESFYRSNLNQLEEDIISRLIVKNITINNGKILRNLRFNLPCSESLYKELTKKEKRFTRNYNPKSRSNAPKLKYKTAKKKEAGLPNLIAKKKKTQKSKTIETVAAPKEKEVIAIKEAKVTTPKAKTSKRNSVDIAKMEKEKAKLSKVEVKKPKTKIEETIVDVKTQYKLDTPTNIEKEVSPKKQNVGVVIEDKKDVTGKKSTIFEKQKQKKKEIEEVKKDSYSIEQASQKEDEKAILESLGVNEKKNNKSKSDEKTDSGVAFDTRAGVEESKNSYDQKSVCPDMILENITVIKKNSNWLTIEYTLTNIGKGPAYLGKDSSGKGLALRAFLSSSENISRGSLPLGGGFVSYKGGKGDSLYPDKSFTSTLKLDIRKMTRFTPFVIINLDPFNVLDECTKANNYGQIKIGR